MVLKMLNDEELILTENEVIEVLGNNYKRQGHELVWRCPACPNGDKSGDNLKFNVSKGILKCFACDFHKVIYGIIARRRMGKSVEYIAPPPAVAPPPSPKQKAIEPENLDLYYYECNQTLMKDKELLRALFQYHTVVAKTAAECLIGFDKSKNAFVFPSKAAGTDPTIYNETYANGAEYRAIGDKKIVFRINGYEAKICRIDISVGVKQNAIICEGYKDAYNLIQLLKILQPDFLSETAIFTLQNGTNSLNVNNSLQKINWRLFKRVGLIFDNDEAGTCATQEAKELFSFFEDWRIAYINGYNDIQERFKKEYSHQVDIERMLNADWLKEY